MNHGDTDTALVERIYRRLNGGNFGSTSKDCIRAVLHASELEAERDRLRESLEKIAATEAAFLRDGPEWVHWREQARRALNA